MLCSERHRCMRQKTSVYPCSMLGQGLTPRCLLFAVLPGFVIQLNLKTADSIPFSYHINLSKEVNLAEILTAVVWWGLLASLP